MTNWEGYEPQRKYYEKNKVWMKKFRRDLRKEVIEAYGSICACCGEYRWQFLTLDHPKGDGQKDRAKHRNITGQIYGWAKKNGFPKIYQLLCMNCNWVRRYDLCPHEMERLTKTQTEPKLAPANEQPGYLQPSDKQAENRLNTVKENS